eukprot:c14908_g1_i1 orf=223-429(-)
MMQKTPHIMARAEQTNVKEGDSEGNKEAAQQELAAQPKKILSPGVSNEDLHQVEHMNKAIKDQQRCQV